MSFENDPKYTPGKYFVVVMIVIWFVGGILLPRKPVSKKEKKEKED